MNDVTALVLSVGEDFTQRAIRSVERQTLPAATTIVVSGVSPFHRALEHGAAQVGTEYFVQIDADMILDDICIGDLRAQMADGAGIVMGHLRDPLLGRIVGIKLFRTRCFKDVPMRDSLSPETDFREDLLRAGWTTVYALKFSGELPGDWHTFGEHRPEYDPRTTFVKYMREGAKARYRKAGGGLRDVFRRLQASRHNVATIAMIAAANGIFVKDEHDIQAPDVHGEQFGLLEGFLRGPEAADGRSASQNSLVHKDLELGFKRSLQLGIGLRQNPQLFMTHLAQLCGEESVAGWVALVGLCHGLLVEQYHEQHAEADFALLKDLLPIVGHAASSPTTTNGSTG